jgi:hypothetical protein
MIKNPATVRGNELSAGVSGNDIHDKVAAPPRLRTALRCFLTAAKTGVSDPWRGLEMAAAVMVFQLACACAFGATVADSTQRDISHARGEGAQGTQSPHTGAIAATTRQDKRPPDLQPPLPDPVPSPQAERVSQIAERNGDKNFLLVDKARGEIFLFENGKPTVGGAALTGAGLGDRIPPKVMTYTGNHPLTVEEKVTPAGRFTVRQEADNEFGRTLTINEIQGKDWDIAIHRVYLGTPSEHRDVRIRSSNVLDRHITYGCINVLPNTIQLFTSKLPRKGNTPIYILPQDESMTDAFFPVRESAPAPKTPTG